MEEKKKKFGFFRQIGTAVARPKKYGRFLYLSTGRVIAFVFIFVLLTTFVSYYLPFAISQIFGESYMDIIDEYVPEFKLENDILALSEPFEYDDGTTLVIANSGIPSFSQDDLAVYSADHANVYLIGQTNMIFYSSGQTTTYAYADLTVDQLDKEGLRDYVPGMYMMIVVSGLMNFILNSFFYFFGALILMLFGRLMMSLWNLRLSYMEFFKLGVFSKVLYEMIAALLQMFNAALPMGFFIGIATGFIYLSIAVRQLRAEGYESGSARGGNDRSGRGGFFGKPPKSSSGGIYSRANMNTAAYPAPKSESDDTKASE